MTEISEKENPAKRKLSRKKNIVAHFDEWIDEDGNLRRMVCICTFFLFHGTAVLGKSGDEHVHNSCYHGLVSQAELEGINGEVQVIIRSKTEFS